MIASRIYTFLTNACGPGSVVGITTSYGLDGPRIESELHSRHRTGRLCSAVSE